MNNVVLSSHSGVTTYGLLIFNFHAHSPTLLKRYTITVPLMEHKSDYTRLPYESAYRRAIL